MHACLVLLIALGLASSTTAAPPAKSVSAPDVMILVLSMVPPNDQVTIQYNSLVSSDVANADLGALAKETGWMFENAEVVTMDSGSPGAVPTTSANFQTIRIINYVDGTFPNAPFIDTFKRFKTIEVRYLVGKDFKFRGLRDFEDRYVKIDSKREGNSYVYRIQVKDSDFDRIKLPEKVGSTSRGNGMPVGLRVLLILLIAAFGAVAVYLLTSLIAKRRAGRDNVETYVDE